MINCPMTRTLHSYDSIPMCFKGFNDLCPTALCGINVCVRVCVRVCERVCVRVYESG